MRNSKLTIPARRTSRTAGAPRHLPYLCNKIPTDNSGEDRLLINISFVFVFRDFIRCCGAALDLNDQLIQADQKMYQEDLKDKYSSMRNELASYIDLVSFRCQKWD